MAETWELDQAAQHRTYKLDAPLAEFAWEPRENRPVERVADNLNPFVMLKNCCAESHEVDDRTVGQYTGRFDSNERRIFEGDICRHHDPLISGTTDYEVVWFPEGSRWGVRELGSSGIYIDDLDDFFCPHCEVVGTIFDDRT